MKRGQKPHRPRLQIGLENGRQDAGALVVLANPFLPRDEVAGDLKDRRKQDIMTMVKANVTMTSIRVNDACRVLRPTSDVRRPASGVRDMAAC